MTSVSGGSGTGHAVGMSIWTAVDRLVDRAPHLSDLRGQRIELLAARRWRMLGRPIPSELVLAERKAAISTLTAPAVLEKVRACYDGCIVVMKGLEVAARYPDPALRTFGDIDLLVPDAAEAQHALLAAGFQPLGDYPELYVHDVHHLRPLWWPGLPVYVEVHKRPNWPFWLSPPPTGELVSAAVPSSSGVKDVLALHPSHHALVLAAHAWGRAPLGTLRDLIDIAAMADGLERSELDACARRWGMERIWRTMTSTIDAVLFEEGPTPLAVRIWARHLEGVRDRTVLENHVQRWLSSFWALPARKATRAAAKVIFDELRPAYGETWSAKLRRSGRAIRAASRRESEHKAALGPEGIRLRDRWR
jgi:hypothetical protein